MARKKSYNTRHKRIIKKGAGRRDFGRAALNTVTSTVEGTLGVNLYDPKMETDAGRKIEEGQDAYSAFVKEIAPTALNMVVPGAGTALQGVQAIGAGVAGESVRGFSEERSLGSQNAYNKAIGESSNLGLTSSLDATNDESALVNAATGLGQMAATVAGSAELGTTNPGEQFNMADSEIARGAGVTGDTFQFGQKTGQFGQIAQFGQGQGAFGNASLDVPPLNFRDGGDIDRAEDRFNLRLPTMNNDPKSYGFVGTRRAGVNIPVGDRGRVSAVGTYPRNEYDFTGGLNLGYERELGQGWYGNINAGRTGDSYGGGAGVRFKFADGGNPFSIYEAEDKEVIQGSPPRSHDGTEITKLSSGMYQVDGKTHEKGGAKLSGGEYVYSDKLQLDSAFLDDLN